MADPPSSPERTAGPDRGRTAGTPRWVKVAGVAAIVVLLLLLILLLTGGNHALVATDRPADSVAPLGP
jgi:hypothetical protein